MVNIHKFLTENNINKTEFYLYMKTHFNLPLTLGSWRQMINSQRKPSKKIAWILQKALMKKFNKFFTIDEILIPPEVEEEYKRRFLVGT